MIISSSWLVHANGCVTTLDGRRANGKKYGGRPPKRRGLKMTEKGRRRNQEAIEHAKESRRVGLLRGNYS